MGIPLTQQASNESRLSMSESVSEFFDAQEVLLSASSSENEVRMEDGSDKQLWDGREREKEKERQEMHRQGQRGLPGSQIKCCCDGTN